MVGASRAILRKMATIPVQKSYQQILGEQLNSVRSRLGIRKFKPGGPLLSILEAAAQADARAVADIFTALHSRDLDSSEGIALDRIGAEEDLPRRDKKAARGYVTISDTDFTKISSTLYHGKPAPIVGSTTVYVAKGDTFDTASSTGQIYIGRSTRNYEGPIAYSAKVDSGYYWTLTVTATTKFHNKGESVILAQGGARPIGAGQIVSTAQGASTAPVTFRVVESAVIPDGETEVTSVQIVCTVDGVVGNVPADSIVSFGGALPFSTATVTNPQRIAYGRDVEQDPDYKERIRQARSNRQRGTDFAIKNAVIDVSSADEASSVLSASVVRRQNKPTVLYIDDGSGYEEKSSGIGTEVLIDSAAGGETDFYTAYSPIAQAYIEATNDGPYTIIEGSSLVVRVGGVSATHFFDSSTFNDSFLSASVLEVVSSINSNYSLPFQARVTNNGQSFAIFSKEENNDDIEVVEQSDESLDAAIVFGLGTAKTYTTCLYKNDVLLSKDGKLAQLSSNPYSNWGALYSSETLIINVDRTGAATYTITDSTFQALGYPALSNDTPDIWAEVINSKIPGITATVEYDRLVLVSNKGRNDSASIEITGGTLVSKQMFATDSDDGISSDYTIDRSVGSIVLATPLEAGDKLSLGTDWAEGFVETDFGSSTMELTADSKYSIVIDGDPEVISTSVFRTGAFSSVSYRQTPTTNIFRLESSASPVAVDDLEAKDWLLFNDSIFSSPWDQIFRNQEDGYAYVIQGADQATRIGHTVTAVPDSGVIVMGGATSAQIGVGLPGALKGRAVTGNCQLYDPSTGVWTQLPSMITPRAYHTATLMQNGNIFVAGGFGVDGQPLSSTEIFDTTAQTFSAGPGLPTSGSDSTPLPRVHHSATLLSSGMVLIAGGCSTLTGSALVTTIKYNPGSNTYQTCGDLNVARYGHQAVLDVDSDYVFVFGGISTIASPATPITSVESYEDSFFTWTSRTAMSSARAFFGACVLAGTPSKIIVAGNGSRFHSDNQETVSTATGTSDLYDYSAEPAPWAGEEDIVSGYVYAKFVQSDLVASYTSGSVIAGNVVAGTTPGAANVKAYIFNVGTGTWDVFTESTLHTMAYLDNREATRAAAVVGSSIDTVCWFGGAICTDFTTQSFSGITNVDVIDATLLTRVHPASVFTDSVLTEGRLLAVRSLTKPFSVTIDEDSGYSYTANSLADFINELGEPVEANVLDTTKLRLSTLSIDGDILVLDKDAELVEFSPSTPVVSQQSQRASVISRNELLIPEDFQLRTITANTVNSSGLPQTIEVTDYSNSLGSSYCPKPMPANGNVVGLELSQSGSPNTSSTLTGDHYSNCKGVASVIGSLSNGGEITLSNNTYPSVGYKAGLRKALAVTPGHPVYVSSPNKFSVTDTLNVTIDGDVSTKRFVIPMARKMGTNGTYQSPLSLNDQDNGGETISSSFGIDYDFDDFAVLSRARTISHPADATKKALWRYYRYGEEGNFVSVRYMYPDSPDASLTVTTSAVQELSSLSYYEGKPRATVDIILGGGDVRQNRSTSSDTRFGVTLGGAGSSNHVWSSYIFIGFKVLEGSRTILNGDTTLDLYYPYISGAVTNSGLAVGDVLWYEGNSPGSSTLQNGAFTIKTISEAIPGITTITIEAGELNDGTIWAPEATPGTVSCDPKGEATFDAEVTVGDLVKFVDATDTVESHTMVIDEIGDTRQYLSCSVVDYSYDAVTVPQYSKLTSSSDFQVFAPPSQTITEVVAAVNAIAGCPISGVVTGSGDGVIDESTWSESGNASTRYDLSDGINYVATTNDPANITLPTTFDLKLPIASSLTSSNDFENEIFYLVPQLTKSIVGWLNTPTVSGLWSVADVTSCNNGASVQIKTQTPGKSGSVFVEGGSANAKTASIVGRAQSSEFNSQVTSNLVLTTSESESEGLCGNSLVELNNTHSLVKVSDNDSNWGVNNTILEIDEDGAITFGYVPYVKETIAAPIGFIEKIGDITAIRLSKLLTPATMAQAKAGNWINITSTASPAYPTNYGTFRILRFTQTETEWVIWIDNPNSVEADEFGVYTTINLLSYNSIIPGDVISINSDVFGEGNRGLWTVLEVGNGYTDTVVTVSIVDKKTLLFSGGEYTYIENVSVIEKEPAKALKKLLCISPNELNTNNVDLMLDDDSLSYAWNQTAGTVITAKEKLNLSATLKSGSDAYRHNTGLIAESKRVIYGDSADPENYSGYVSEGARVLIQGPVIKSIKLTLQIRLQINSTSKDVLENIKSAVAGYINDSLVGVSIPISEIIAVVSGVSGVAAVSIVSPNYNSVEDRITVRGQEKAIVVDPENDIKVLVVGN